MTWREYHGLTKRSVESLRRTQRHIDWVNSRKKQQKNRRDSIKDSRFHVLPPERSLREFTTSVNPVWRLLPLRVVYGQTGSNRITSCLPTTRKVARPVNARAL